MQKRSEPMSEIVGAAVPMKLRKLVEAAAAADGVTISTWVRRIVAREIMYYALAATDNGKK